MDALAARLRQRRRRSERRFPLLCVLESPHRVVGEINVLTLGELGQDLLPDRVLRTASLAGLDQVAERELHTTVDHLRVDDRRELAYVEQILMGGRTYVLI